MPLGRSRKTETEWDTSAYGGDGNLLGDNIDTIKKNTETLIDASKEVGSFLWGASCCVAYM
jgi:hypothetical protein